MRFSALLLLILLALTVTAAVEATKGPSSGKQPAGVSVQPSG